jgi:hypothetical protein
MFNKKAIIKASIKILAKEIKDYFYHTKKRSVRDKIILNKSKSLWDKVKLAKNLNIHNHPKKLSLGETWMNSNNLPSASADHFKTNKCLIVNKTKTDQTIYNGKQKIRLEKSNFVSKDNV